MHGVPPEYLTPALMALAGHVELSADDLRLLAKASLPVVLAALGCEVLTRENPAYDALSQLCEPVLRRQLKDGLTQHTLHAYLRLVWVGVHDEDFEKAALADFGAVFDLAQNAPNARRSLWEKKRGNTVLVQYLELLRRRELKPDEAILGVLEELTEEEVFAVGPLFDDAEFAAALEPALDASPYATSRPGIAWVADRRTALIEASKDDPDLVSRPLLARELARRDTRDALEIARNAGAFEHDDPSAVVFRGSPHVDVEMFIRQIAQSSVDRAAAVSALKPRDDESRVELIDAVLRATSNRPSACPRVSRPSKHTGHRRTITARGLDCRRGRGGTTLRRGEERLGCVSAGKCRPIFSSSTGGQNRGPRARGPRTPMSRHF